MKAKPIIYEEIKDYFKLDEQGYLWGLDGRYNNKWNPVYLSKPNKSHGYLQVKFKGRRVNYYQHRIIYSLHTKQDVPVDLFIDHQNGIRSDNRVENLRLVTQRENHQNQSKHRGGKLVGANYSKRIGKWTARIRLANGELITLGPSNSEIEANAKYQEALELVYLSKAEIQKHFNVAQKSSKYKGVHWCKRDCKWIAKATVNGKSKCIGYFDNEEEAYEAYLKFKGGNVK